MTDAQVFAPETAVDTLKRWLGVGQPPATSSPLADVISSPEAGAADIPQSQVPASTASPPVTTKGLVDAGVRGVGLGTRATVEGVSGLPAMAADAVTWPMRATQRALGIPTTAPSDIVTHGLDAAGLPKPETPSEQLTSATVGGVASVLPTVAAGVTPALIRAYPTVAKALAERLLAQTAAGGASAGAQEETRQLGGGPVAQFGVGTLAGLLAAHAVSPNTLAPSPGSGPRFIQEYFGEGTPTNPLAAYPPKQMPAFVPPGTNLPPEPLLRQPQPIQEGTVTPQGGPAPSPQEPPAFVPPKAQPADAGGATQTAAAAPPPTGESAASIAASGGYREAPVPQSPLAPTVGPDGTLVPPQPSAPPTTAAEAKRVASSYYDIANQPGNDATLTPQFFDKIYNSAKDAGKQTEAGQLTAGPNAVTALLDRWQGLQGKPLPLASAQEMYEGLGDLIDQEWSGGRLSKVGAKLAQVQSDLRDQIDNPAPGDTAGNAASLAAFAPARQAWSQAMKMDDLERIQYRASLTDNPATSIKTQIRGLLTDPRNVYSDTERAALEDAATRGTLGSVLHVFGGRLVPLVAGAAGLSHGPIGGLISAGVTHLGSDYLRNWAGNIQQNKLGGAINVMGQGVPPPPGSPLQ